MTDMSNPEGAAVKVFDAPPLNGAIRIFAEEHSYLEYDALLPKQCAPQELEAVKAEVLDHLAQTEIMALSTVTPEGWPAMHEMHFSTVVDVGRRPVIYSFTHPNTRKGVNIPANPRVALSAYKTISFERRRETRAFYGRGLAHMVSDDAEWSVAEEAHWSKQGQGYAKLLRIEGQPLIRIDILQGVWFNPARKPRHCLIDYPLDVARGG
jgi:nitroimidazol reductase NimA-like FMN-containing flavoprotein (pyridoxamine 5'-phosphate oxidase superfamily)